MNTEELEKMDEELTNEQRILLIRHRGGCSCHINPPCSNCCNPLTEDEAEWLLWLLICKNFPPIYAINQ